jgi:hypothetical protein
MPNLLEGSSPLEIDHAVSLPHSLLATASLLCAAPRFEGLSDRLWVLRNRVPADLLAEICHLVTFPGAYQRFTSELMGYLPDGAADLGFNAFRSHLETIPGIHYQLIALRALGRGSTPSPSPTELIELTSRPEEWAAYLARVESPIAPETVAALVGDGEALKRRVLTAVSRFWQGAYATEFEATRPLMERSVAHHRAQSYRPVFRDIFVAMTGRLMPERLEALLPSISRAILMPSCYVGPYVAYSHYGQELVLFYNCRSTPSESGISNETALYPPLKALGDETRLQILALLQGQELYAQEIVERLDISQPAVSRHLNLMTAAGVLKSRREGNAKYYSIDNETLIRLAEALRAMV